jgi:hypothetical protein
VGHRYGAVTSDTGKSFIEAEYEAAERQKKPLLVFLADDDAPWPPKYIDRDQTRIQNFRQRLLSDRIVQFFTRPNDLQISVEQALALFVKSLQRPPQLEINKSRTKREVTIVRLLLSSPGDVSEERDRVAKAVFRSISCQSKRTACL